METEPSGPDNVEDGDERGIQILATLETGTAALDHIGDVATEHENGRDKAIRPSQHWRQRHHIWTVL